MTPPQERFVTGDIIRYSDGISALFRYCGTHNADRLYGDHVMGGKHSACDMIFFTLQKASEQDLEFCRQRQPNWFGKIILLNGPPSSGKDTAAKHIRQLAADWKLPKIVSVRVALDRMSLPIKRAFAGTMGLPITEDGIVEPWESKKEEIIPEFGVSYRQWQIDFSESFLKRYRQEIFGELLAARIARRFQKGIANLIVVPDCGFATEINTIYRTFGHESIMLIRCHRPGFTFEGDSRSYVHAPKGCAFAAGGGDTIEQHQKWVEEVVKTWLESPEKLPREE